MRVSRAIILTPTHHDELAVQRRVAWALAQDVLIIIILLLFHSYIFSDATLKGNGVQNDVAEGRSWIRYLDVRY